MSNIVLPEVGPNETLPEYIKRLIDTKIIQSSQINLAINKFNKK